MQPDLFSQPPPDVRPTDPHTSRIAATVAAAGRPGGCARIYTALADGPATDAELAARTGMHPGSAAKRRLDLVRAGLVEPVLDDHGDPVTRPTPTGCPALVWQAS